MILVILASGRGSRLKSLTKKNPKCLTKIIKNYTLLDHISLNFKLFDKIIVVTGYKSNLIKKKLKSPNIKFVFNKNYLTTNMVESLMLTYKKIKDNDIVVVYSDIFFDTNIIVSLLKYKSNILPLNSNWLKSWKKRYNSIKKIKSDAENLTVRKNKLIHIGGKIRNKLPKLQYMGIFKIKNKAFKKLYHFYLNINNKRINMTNFIDLTIRKKLITFNYFSTKNYWYEVDNLKDLKVLRKDIKKLLRNY